MTSIGRPEGRTLAARKQRFREYGEDHKPSAAAKSALHRCDSVQNAAGGQTPASTYSSGMNPDIKYQLG
jgi:hypothetical protein